MKQKGGKKIDDTPLHKAARDGNISRVEQLLYKGDYIDMKNKNGLTPLHQSVIFGNHEMVNYLLDSRSNVNLGDNEGATPLHMAVNENIGRITQLLLNRSGRNLIPPNFCFWYIFN